MHCCLLYNKHCPYYLHPRNKLSARGKNHKLKLWESVAECNCITSLECHGESMEEIGGYYCEQDIN